VLLPIGVAALMLGLGYGRTSRTGDLRGEPLSFGNLRFVLSRPPLWCLALPFLMGVCNNIGVFSMLPLYLQAERGLDQSVTNLLLSASRWAGMLSVTVTGWAVARLNAKAVAGAVLFLTGSATVGLGVCPTSWIWLPLFVQSTLAPAFFPPAFAILTRIVPVSYRNLIVALIVAICMLIGGGVLPTLIGAFGDAGMFYAGFVLTGALTLASTGLLARVRLADGIQAEELPGARREMPRRADG
jgi:NNP family nitrate/nitrite transporter-like MFS transporter